MNKEKIKDVAIIAFVFVILLLVNEENLTYLGF